MILGREEFLLGDFHIIHKAIFAMGRAVDVSFIVVVPTTEIEPAVGCPFKAKRSLVDTDIADVENIPPLHGVDAETALQGVLFVVASGKETIAEVIVVVTI